MTKFKLLSIIIAFPVLAFSQISEDEIREMVLTAKEQQLVIESSSMIQENYYYLAEIIVDKLLTIQPESANYNYRKGFLILGARSDYKKALPYLIKASQSVSKNYDAYSANETTAPIDAYYHLGNCYHLDEQLVEAKKYYNLFLTNSNKNSAILSMAVLKLKQCDIAKELIENPKSAIVKNIGNKINGKTPEYAPVVSLDGTSLYFTSRRAWEDNSSEEFRDPMLNDYPEDIYVSYKDFEGEWTSPEKLAFCDNQLNEATIAVSSDERKIYVYQDISGGGDIYFSDFDNNQFGELEKLREKSVNTQYWETHCTVTPDGQNMYFVSNRPGGLGGRDIYRIVKLPNGEWSEAQNMGPGINTEFDEDSPFIAVNNNTLYYSSNGPESMGGFDIFVTFRDEENNWSVPLNLGYPINSTGDDVFYTTTVDGLRGYLSSFRDGGFGEKDIYEIQNDYLGNRPISSLRGTVMSIDGTLATNITIKLECPKCELEAEKVTYPRLKHGSYFSVLNRCKDYVVSFYEGDVLLHSAELTTLCTDENEEIVRNYITDHYTLAGTVSDDKSLELLPNSSVEFMSIEDESILATFTTDEKGAFVSDYLNDKRMGDRIQFNVRVKKENYLTQNFAVDMVLANVPHIQLDYLINKTEIGTDIGLVFKINPIYFDLDKSFIRPDAALELDKIVKIMNENPSVTIELGSHTDCRATKSYNMALSNRRAKSSAKYVQERIDDSKRIYGKGYGETQLVNDCECEGNQESDCSEEEHQANRRTEFRIVKK